MKQVMKLKAHGLRFAVLFDSKEDVYRLYMIYQVNNKHGFPADSRHLLGKFPNIGACLARLAEFPEVW